MRVKGNEKVARSQREGDDAGLRERLAAGETVLCAEGYLLELERRGYLKAGSFVPEVVLEHPHLVKNLYEEFVHAGSDVIEAFTYYAHREKLRTIGREQDLEPLNRSALRMAKEVAERTGTLMAGNVSKTTVFDPKDPKTHEYTRQIFKEEVLWAVEEGADFIIAETMWDYGEAKLALEAIKHYALGLPAVVNLVPGYSALTRDGFGLTEALQNLRVLGADVVGINCSMGPHTMMPLMKELRSKLDCPLSAVPVPYRTEQNKGMYFLTLPDTGEKAYPRSLDYFLVCDAAIREFGKAALENDIQFIGLCCGNNGRYMRSLAESVGRSPPASIYSPDIGLVEARLAEVEKIARAPDDL